MPSNAYKRTVWLAGIRIGANVIMLAAVCVAMYQSFLHPAEALSVFCQWFFGITILTWIGARQLAELVRRRLADADEGLVRLPGHKKSALMRWRVAEPSLAPSFAIARSSRHA